ncbi:tRNA (adenosine(37)-N6)-threonylcarbamoyltransferase complex transferase subunit TsaD [Brevundimonas sp. SORGH_AS_0993]|uniref:tRNA (adenosine(37)-N6)-threonylcarbamoyltransferase complex transferase subunit TsaD n=1 Tax=Brevundimonas sp. SORGH_AS_0993 TaxID=3041794 RepID=UPI002781E320|nr:tRNA (adenosine(37)-N6)-threonylcarbamoyltransferase complex transferase subunit TsaD [Brevundimonas sp. SORGH_AS_0993]MDQ1155531.1 N6-L-threonylcarbamoyladenine synthase [Brevundimonas sp. SORGH_AS_0993]
MNVAYRSSGRYLGPMESSADYSSGAAAATGRDVPPLPGEALTVLGLETSCDETAASVVRLHPSTRGGRAEVLSSVVHSQIDDHAAYGGVVPEIAARSHVEMIDGVTRRAMVEAGLDWSDLDGIAATAGPGLVGGVMVGLSYGKAVSLARDLPLVAVNHLEGHAVSARLGAEVAYPFLLLLVSGGHCQLLEVRGVGDMSRIGATIDDAAGEAFDKIAKALGLGYPGGPALERLAAQGDGSGIDLPRALLGRKDCDFSFSGLKTAAFRIAQTCETAQDKANLADAVQTAIARQLSDRSERALAAYAERHEALMQAGSASRPIGQKRLFVVAGGVAANKTIRAVLEATAAKQGFDFLAPPLAYCTDNAAMIALAGAERLALGLTSDIDVIARPRWPLDEARALSDPSHRPGRKGAKA